MELELLFLAHVKSSRVGDFKEYINTLEHLMGWIFGTDQLHYKRNLPVHLRDLRSLQTLHPQIFLQLLSGKFVGHKTHRAFSGLPWDQLHEQLIRVLKGDGGIIGITENMDKLKEFMVLAPEFVRLIEEFEEGDATIETKHHEQYKKFQDTFHQVVKLLAGALRDYGNPFLEDSKELIALHSSKVMGEEVVKSIRNLYIIGAELYATFTQERILSQEVAWNAKISSTKLPLMGSSHKPSNQKTEARVLKQERSQYLQMMLSVQAGRDINEEVFANESSEYPPSLTRKGDTYFGVKSELIPCLLSDVQCPDKEPSADGVVLDGCVMLRFITPGLSVNISEYAAKFVSTIDSMLNFATRADVVFDGRHDDSVKLGRTTRSSWFRTKVRPSTKIPSDWQNFLRVTENLRELINIIASHVQQYTRENKTMSATNGARTK